MRFAWTLWALPLPAVQDAARCVLSKAPVALLTVTARDRQSQFTAAAAGGIVFGLAFTSGAGAKLEFVFLYFAA